MWEDFLNWIDIAPEARGYLHLTWEEDIESAKAFWDKKV